MPTVQARLQATIPDNWFFKESITLLAPDGQANVIVSSEPLDPSISVDKYAEVQGELLRKEFPRFIQHAFAPSVVFGRFAGYLREFSWTPPDGVAVTQLQAYAVHESRGYTATATTPATGYRPRAHELRRILLSAWSA